MCRYAVLQECEKQCQAGRKTAAVTCVDFQ